MKSLLQQLKPGFPLYKRASLLLFLFLTILKLNAQVFYYVKDTHITISENTTVYIVNTGEINQEKLKDFELKTPVKKQSFKIEHTAFNKKSNAEKKASKHHEKEIKTYPKPKSLEFAMPNPDDFFSSHQKGMAVSASVNTPYDSNFFIENTKLKPLQGYTADLNNEITYRNSDILQNLYLSQHTTRPPPFEFYI